jgi:hypothetical protein
VIIYHRHAGGALQSYNEHIVYILGGVIAAPGGRIMSSLANSGGLAHKGGIAGQGGGLAA